MRRLLFLLLAACATQPLAEVPEPLPEALAWSGGAQVGAFLGVKAEENDSRSLDALFFEEGVRVSRVVENSPAERAGIAPGDVLLAFDGQPLSDPAGLDALVAGAKSGWSVLLRVRRADTVFELPVTLAGEEGGAPQAEPLYRIDRARSRAGWTSEPGGGARLVSLAPDSPLDLPLASVVRAVDGRPVLSDRELLRVLATYEPGAEVQLTLADGRQVEVELAGSPRRMTALFIPILFDYEASPDGGAVEMEILDFWLFALFRYERIGLERRYELLEFFEFATGVGELES